MAANAPSGADVPNPRPELPNGLRSVRGISLCFAPLSLLSARRDGRRRRQQEAAVHRTKTDRQNAGRTGNRRVDQ